ncbi:MAG: NAD(P)/FAD-dependent oxidoreductase [Candidatus Omnitrophica bacterium]|nr:NAD(P)/FAD-dependent oxidoreductase [Candidatus Omnitrophota bacterium]
MEKVDTVIIGAGIIGLSCAAKLAEENTSIVVIEENASFGQETSSRNSEVIHAGLYYRPGSLKLTCCVRGKELLYQLCKKNRIPYRKTGKLIIAADRAEEAKIEDIFQNVIQCGITTLRYLSRKEISSYAPDVNARTALFSPESGIIDSHSYMQFLYQTALDRGVVFSFSTEVVRIRKESSGYTVTVKEPQGTEFAFQAEKIINCGGLHSDNIASLAGIDIERNHYKIHYCKGQYFRLGNPQKYSIARLIYPPATGVSLGIHITPDMAGGLRVGPDSYYCREIDYTVDIGQKQRFYEEIKKFLPEVTIAELIGDTAGIRPKLQAEHEDFRDFVIKEESDQGFPGFINLIGIESPGLTAALAIAEKILDMS